MCVMDSSAHCCIVYCCSEVPRSGSSRPPPSMLNVRNIGLCVLIVAGVGVALLILPSQKTII